MTDHVDELQVQVELDAEGNSSGVEVEDLGGEIREPFDPKLIDVVTEVRSLDILAKRIQAGHIDLDPDFQRSRGIWTPKKKSLLIESLLLRIPLPTFYVAELDAGSALGDNPWAVVDGIQRLSTIVEFISPESLGLRPLRLNGLEYLHDEDGKTFQDLSPSLQLRLLESQFTMQVIRRSTPEAVKLNIFARINTGGVPLSPQELRHALVPGRSRLVLKSLAASADFKSAVSNSVSASRMSDREMVLRFIAFRNADPESYREPDLDAFLRQTMRHINAWDASQEKAWVADFSRSMRLSRLAFGDDAFRKRYKEGDARRPVSKALFEAVGVSFSRLSALHGVETEALVKEKTARIRREFLTLMADRAFERSISQGTGDPLQVRVRFLSMQRMLEDATS